MKTLLVILLFPIVTFGQTVVTFDELSKFDSYMDSVLTNFSDDSLNVYFAKEYNEYLISKKLDSVSYSENLLVVCKDQSDYCLKNNVISHNQPTQEKENSIKRAEYYKKQEILLGENMSAKSNLFLFIDAIKQHKSFYEVLSEDLIKRWSDSPGHNKNLLRGSDGIYSLGVSINKEKLVACLLVGYQL
jgi:uncharacterized protein YkwD